MNLTPSKQDIEFRDAFEIGNVPASEFHHRDHLRLAYVYLCENETSVAFNLVKGAILRFLKLNGVPAEKYHETITLAWIQAVRHFMERCHTAESFDELIANDVRLLDTEIMLTHYKRETLYSDTARYKFVSPDLQPIPQY